MTRFNKIKNQARCQSTALNRSCVTSNLMSGANGGMLLTFAVRFVAPPQQAYGVNSEAVQRLAHSFQSVHNTEVQRSLQESHKTICCLRSGLRGWKVCCLDVRGAVLSRVERYRSRQRNGEDGQQLPKPGSRIKPARQTRRRGF